MGNCGVGFAPTRQTGHELVIKLMEGVEDIPEVVMEKGVPWNWESFTDYLDALDERESDIDFATQLPHSPLRVFVMGERGANLEPPTAEDLVQMRNLVRQAVEAGALGVSSSRNLFHRFRSGALAPSVKSEEDELLALAAGLSDAKAGVFQCNPNLDHDAETEMAVFNNIVRACGRPLNFSLISTPHRPDNWNRYISAVKQARAEGLDIHCQFMPRPIGVLYGLDLSFNPFSLNPSFRAIAALPLADKVARLRDPELRKRLIAEQPEDPNPAFVISLKSSKYLFVVPEPANYDFRLEDSLQAKAVALGLPLKELIYDTLLEDDGHAILCSYTTTVDEYSEYVKELIGGQGTIVALGDGGAHYGMICDAAYTTYVLSARVGRNGLSLETAVKALTSQPAASVALGDRGIIEVGYKADLNVIDLERLSLHRPKVHFDLPAGGKRLMQEAEGYVAAVVSGTITYREGQSTGALPGRLVRHARQAPPKEQAPLAASSPRLRMER
jgi:N-acyl-D-aspartate/D-glutamate deacylase